MPRNDLSVPAGCGAWPFILWWAKRPFTILPANTPLGYIYCMLTCLLHFILCIQHSSWNRTLFAISISVNFWHCGDVVMGQMASQITSVSMVYPTVCSGADHQSSTGLCEEKSPVTGEFPSPRASKAENVSIWWRHHGLRHWKLVIFSSSFSG